MFVVKSFISVICICVGMVPAVYGQRVYASVDQVSATTLLAGVDNREKATVSPYTDFSHLHAIINLLSGLFGSVYQNLQFPNTGLIPGVNSPVFVKFSVGGSSLATVLGGMTVEATINNVPARTYTSTNLISLLSGVNTPTEVKFTPDVLYDGFRINLSGVLVLGTYADYYYAFFITPPTINNTSACPGTPAVLSVTNVPALLNYQYKWYSVATGGTLLATTSGIYTTENINSAQSFYVEAVEPGGDGIYNSARTRVDVSVLPKPSTPSVQLGN